LEPKYFLKKTRIGIKIFGFKQYGLDPDWEWFLQLKSKPKTIIIYISKLKQKVSKICGYQMLGEYSLWWVRPPKLSFSIIVSKTWN
jgi:hypothetical protein